jgi:hypothetical protein
MTEAEFERLAAQGFNRIPLVAETFADLDTPLSIYLKLANAPNTFLLGSVVGGERGIYGGACDYLSFGGAMDLAIVIRTGIVKDACFTFSRPQASSRPPFRKANGARPKPRLTPSCARPSRCRTVQAEV